LEDDVMNKKVFIIVILVVMTAVLVTGLALAADDGPLFQRNLSRTPDTLSMGAQISVMPLYVPAQNTQGELVEIEYTAGDCTNSDTSGCETIYTMTEAKPLIATYEDGIEHEELNAVLGITGGDAVDTGTGFGERDAFAAVSLDDGATWKDTNLSDSARRSSFFLKTTGEAYPGDVFRINHAVVGNRVAVAWISRFCESGSPLYSWLPEDQLLLAETYELGANLTVDGVEYNTYASDLFGVAGTQKSVDYTLQGFPEVGEVPYGCVWVARGTLEATEVTDPDTGATSESYDITWRQAERLTSGRRDANRVDITGTSGAGFIISWQEDPEGLRPGKGLGPGEGWSGAIANSKTDIWYTYIGWDHFDDVCLDDPDTGLCTSGTLADYVLEGKPKTAVPFAVPMRLTDNNKCEDGLTPDQPGYQPYCYADFDGNGTADLCATSVGWDNPGGKTLQVCETEDGRVLTGRTASTRVRWALKSYDSDSDGVPDSAWVTMAEEKMKALGSELDENEEPIDIGKNMWYHTFNMFNPELVQQGLMLNAPAIDPETGELFEVYADEWENDLYLTEIARRFNLMVQGIGAAMASESKTSAILIYKEGILFQGGPADIFMRRVVLPDDFDPAVDNPFAYENVQCVELDDEGNATPVDLLYPDGVNPNYVRGLCPVQGMNVSGTTIVTCDDGSGGETCADAFPWDTETAEAGYPKVTEWVQAPDNYNDPSWANPYDVSKGHRGFIDGDFVMMMYATAPNWKANTIGNEAYNLYIRRSFDGGQNWTTLPGSFLASNGVTYSGAGTESCEDYGWGGQVEEETCTTYAAGEFEQARNVSRLTGSKITVLDPRYSPTGGMLKTDASSLLCHDGVDWVNCGYDEASAPYPEEIRDPSGFFVTYETGDNTVVTEETATVPLDMYYSRAFNFGDDWDVVDLILSDGTIEQRWDWLEQGPELASEASVFANPDGSKFYTVWNQELEIGVDEHGEPIFTDMDVQFRRILYNLTDTDLYPTASILSTSATILSIADDDILEIKGSGRDHDHIGLGEPISAYAWFDEDPKTSVWECTIEDWKDKECKETECDGEVCWCTDCEDLNKNCICDDKEWKVECDQILKVDARNFGQGRHTINFAVQDNEGNWSTPAETVIWVTLDGYIRIFMPTIVR
jgi:hypothetical protein